VKLVKPELLMMGGVRPAGFMAKSIATGFTAVPKMNLGGMAGTCNALKRTPDFGPTTWTISNVTKTAGLR
jgi:hypothetical protein